VYKRNNLVGKRFGLVAVLKEAGRTKDRHIQYECVCDCGNHKVISGKELLNGHTHSCGCKQRTTHGGRRIKATERLYKVWMGMRNRCRQQSGKNYKYYAGRGIRVCEEWNDYSKFREWAYANGYDENAPYMQCTIDRIDVDGNYEPSNCRWVSMKEQSMNKHMEA